MKRLLALLMLLLTLFSMFSAATADRIPVEHNSRYIGAMKVVRCKEWVTLRAEPYKWAKALAKVPLGAVVYNCSTIKEKKSFVYAEYEGLQGYILLQFLEPAPEYEPAVTSAVSRKMTMEEVAGNADIVLEWHDFNISVVAAHEFAKEGKVIREVLRIGCFIDEQPLWGHIETMDSTTGQTMLKAFIGGTEDDPMVMLYDGGYGLTMFDLLSGAERWTITKGSCDLGDAAVVAADDEGTMYIAGTDGPDPVAVTREGKVLWRAETDYEEVQHPYDIALKQDSIEVKYGDPEKMHYLVSFDYMGNFIRISETAD